MSRKRRNFSPEFKKKLSLRQSEVKKKLMSWPQNTAYNLTYLETERKSF